MSLRRTRLPALLYTLHCGNMYGTERMALATLDGLPEYRRIVFAPPSPTSPSLLEVARSREYEVRQIRTWSGLLWALLPVFATHRSVDVISTSALHNLTCLWLARLLLVRLRQLNVVHGGGEDQYSYAKKHRLNKTTVRLVAVSQFVKQRLLAHHVPPEKIVVINNFLSPSDMSSRPRRPSFDPSHKSSRPLDPRCVRVAVVSRLDPIKRLDVLLDALATGQLSNFQFDIYGSGEMLETYVARAKMAAGKVTFHGYTPNLALVIPQADFFLHLCAEEPFGLVVLEAFSAGVPVVVPEAGGTAELVRNGVNGMTYAPNDVPSLVSCLVQASAKAGAGLDAMVAGGHSSLESRFASRVGADAYRQALAAL